MMVLLAFWVMSATAGTVSVSNYPLLLLSNEVTKGVNPAQMLLEVGDVGHHGSLSPSRMKLAKDSQFVVWFGKELEQNLVNTLQDVPNAISLYQFRAFRRLPLRDVDGTAKTNTLDPHLWLDPDNAKAIVRALAVIHSHASPEHKEQYQQNAQDFARRMDRATAQFAKAQTHPYWAYHDAYQYLESHAKLSFAGALTPDHHLSPKASQIKTLSQNRPQSFMCLLAQGEVSSGIISKLGNVRTLIIQEDMSGGEHDKADFVTIWTTMVADVQQCVR